MDFISFFKNKLALKKKYILEKLKDRSQELHNSLLNILNIRHKRNAQKEGNHVENNIKHRQKRTYKSSAKTTTTTERFGDWEYENLPKDGDTRTWFL